MIHETFKLKVPYEKAGLSGEGLCPTLTAYCPSIPSELIQQKFPAVILCPGGGYEHLSEREAEQVALRYAGNGIAAFILRYSIVNKPFPTALLEAAFALALVRSHAQDWNIDPEKILIGGFSAGGHLAASLATLWDHPMVKEALGFTDEHKPNGAVLSYPVIVSNEYCHAGSIRNIIGEKPSAERLELVSLDKQVSEKTPPVFIWHSADDGAVPVENTLSFTAALSKHKILFESHIFPTGVHGLSLCDETSATGPLHFNPTCAQWFNLSVRFIKAL